MDSFLTDKDKELIRDFQRTPKYKRRPEDLVPDDAEHDEHESQ